MTIDMCIGLQISRKQRERGRATNGPWIPHERRTAPTQPSRGLGVVLLRVRLCWAGYQPDQRMAASNTTGDNNIIGNALHIFIALPRRVCPVVPPHAKLQLKLNYAPVNVLAFPGRVESLCMVEQMPCFMTAVAGLCMAGEITGAFFALLPQQQSGTIVSTMAFNCPQCADLTHCVFQCSLPQCPMSLIELACTAGSVHSSHDYVRWVGRTDEERAEQRKAARLCLDTSAHAGSEYRRLVHVLSNVSLGVWPCLGDAS